MLRFAKRGKTASTVAASVLCLAVTVGAGAAFAATGQLDTTFNTTGKVLLPSTGNDTAWDVATQADGKIVAVGSTTTGNNAMVWRYNIDGTPDMGFNAADTPGSIALDFGGDDLATSVAIAPTGKILDGRRDVTELERFRRGPQRQRDARRRLQHGWEADRQRRRVRSDLRRRRNGRRACARGGKPAGLPVTPRSTGSTPQERRTYSVRPSTGSLRSTPGAAATRPTTWRCSRTGTS